MNKSLEQEIFALEWRIENLAEQEGATRADCIAEFAIKKRNPNCKAVLGVAWHCLERAKDANNENHSELANFYIYRTSRAFGMAETEFNRLLTLRENQANAAEGRRKYDEDQIAEWREYATLINPDGKLNDSEVARRIIKHFELPKSANRTVRDKIRK